MYAEKGNLAMFGFLLFIKGEGGGKGEIFIRGGLAPRGIKKIRH